MDLQLRGKIALITGSSKGIGEAIARGLAYEGATVIIHGRDKARAENVANDIVRDGGKAYFVGGDLTVNNDVKLMSEEVRAFTEVVDIVVNNAGGSGPTEDWTSTRVETWTDGFDKNVLSALRVINLFLPGMRSKRWGRVINISSLAGLMAPEKRPDYSAAKAALIAMSSSLSKAVAGQGITVNTVSPGTIHSARLEEAFRQTGESVGFTSVTPWEEIEHAVLPRYAQVPAGRVGTLEEIADAVSFLVSPRAGYITGSNLRVDGGMWPGI